FLHRHAEIVPCPVEITTEPGPNISGLQIVQMTEHLTELLPEGVVEEYASGRLLRSGFRLHHEWQEARNARRVCRPPQLRQALQCRNRFQLLTGDDLQTKQRVEVPLTIRLGVARHGLPRKFRHRFGKRCLVFYGSLWQV